MNMKLYRCEHCGNVIEKVEDSGVNVVCCGAAMKELAANTADGASEKHVPVYEIRDNVVHVRVGETEHPMMDGHHIQWIAICTTGGMQRRYLRPGEKPEACFALCGDDRLAAVYEYCNLHGLWAAKVQE